MMESIESDELFALLDKASRKRIKSRFPATWDALIRVDSHESILVALDYITEYGIVPAETIAQLRGFPVASGSHVTTANSWVNPKDGSEMIWIDGGSFYVGNDRVKTQCDGFFLARYPITNEQFFHFVDETDYDPHINDDANGFFLNHRERASKKMDHPVTWVSHLDALHYCRWVGMNLPTEWMWEKAARGTDGRNYPWGSFHASNFAQVSKSNTCKVGKFPNVRSPYGCEGLIGNVSEWCWPGEGYSMLPETWPTDEQLEKAAEENVPVRGSAFMRKGGSSSTSHHRRKLSPNRRNKWVGFRPAFTPFRAS